MIARAAGDGLALRAHGLPPDEIMPLSLERLRQRSPVALPPEPSATVALRMAYAAGDPDLLRDIVVGDGAVRTAQEALRRGVAVVCDVAMVAAGVRSVVERGGSRVLCAQDVADLPLSGHHASPATRAAAAASTRTARGLLNLADHWEGAVVVVGNAPTALLLLLDALADGAPLPAALIATPCGLVAAEEAKQLLLDTAPLPFITVRGTRGGSAVAAAAVNACALL
jgi:precorrin-8X/cobalt-precorrin-8 methylmutase